MMKSKKKNNNGTDRVEMQREKIECKFLKIENLQTSLDDESYIYLYYILTNIDTQNDIDMQRYKVYVQAQQYMCA